MRSCANQTVDNILISIPSRGRVSSFRAQSQRCKAWWTMFTNYAVAPVLQTNYQLLLYGHCTYQNNNNGPRVINTNYASTQRTLLFLNFTTLLWYACNKDFFVSFVWIFGLNKWTKNANWLCLNYILSLLKKRWLNFWMIELSKNVPIFY